MDKIKMTIMRMLREKFKNIPVVSSPLFDNTNNQHKFLIVSKIDTNKVRIIDYDKYIRKGIEVTPSDIDLEGKEVRINDIGYNVIGYEPKDGIVFLDMDLKKDIFEYNDTIDFLDSKTTKDFILCYSTYGYDKTLDGGCVEHYNRYNIDIFINEDINEDMFSKYKNEISKLFYRNFIILDKEGNKTRDVAYITTQLSFNISEYNVTNKIIRGSMLIKTYTYE